MADAEAVNQHYLDRVVSLSETSLVEASEDIVGGNGVKLLAKGARIDARVRERLLAHKLAKPLEATMRVADGVATRKIDRVADMLIERHLLLSNLCGAATGRMLCAALRDLILTQQVDSILTVYAAQGEGKLEHAVGIALLAAAMASEMPEGAPPADVMLMAGLLHDVGELYIDPAILAAGPALTTQQWKHIAAHPVVGSRVLGTMPGAGPKVAVAVLHHHERLDGFGYPQGLRGDAVSLSGQVLAMAELLMGLIESPGHHPEQAGVAVKLIPGEFNRWLLDKVATAAYVEADTLALRGDEDQARLREQALQVFELLARARRLKEELRPRLDGASAAGQALLQHVIERCERIATAFFSTGLDAQDSVPGAFDDDPRALREAATVLKEIQWRLRELRREADLRAERLPAAEAAMVQRFVAELAL
jgi:hypothetical protein